MEEGEVPVDTTGAGRSVQQTGSQSQLTFWKVSADSYSIDTNAGIQTKIENCLLGVWYQFDCHTRPTIT